MNLTEIINYVNTFNNSAYFYTPKIYKSGRSILFKKPVEIITAKNKHEFTRQLKSVNSLLDKGLTGYGLINYEAGYLLEEKLTPFFKESDKPVLRFCFFEKDQIEYYSGDEIDYSSVKDFIQAEKYNISNFHLNTREEEYKKNIELIRNYIKEGDTYQVNYTVKGKFDFTGSIKSLFLNLIFNQSAEYSALINTGEEFIISISPELFFEVSGYRITARPMKGTAKRGLINEEDKVKIDLLSNSSKDRAENVMILDLLRNDLGRISNFNSVKAEPRFKVEKYESLFQMTSTVEANLITNNFEEIIKNIFPCGSITGAPKIRTMEIINELEKEERGVYTGTIGIAEKDSYKFNVPIRTIKISKEGKGEIGLGSGVVWDSRPEEEYNETLLKSNFITRPEKYFELFESILIERGKPYLLEEHLFRLKEAAGYFLFNYDFEKIRNKILESAERIDVSKKYKMRIDLDKWGGIRIQNSEFRSQNLEAGIENDKIKIVVSDKRISSLDKFRYFKTTNRNLYDDELKKYRDTGFYEVIFLNEKDKIAEGSFTNIFIRKNGKWMTPALQSGILNGVYRGKLLKDTDNYSGVEITLDDLINAEKVIIVNSVRKEITVNEIWTVNKSSKKLVKSIKNQVSSI